MKEKSPFDNVFDQITELLNTVQKKKLKSDKKRAEDKVPYDDMEEQLDALERDLELFRLITDEAVQKAGINEKQLKKNIMNPPDTFAGKDRKLLRRAKKIQNQTSTLEKRFKDKAAGTTLKKKKQTAANKKRMKKFRRLGGTDWLPL